MIHKIEEDEMTCLKALRESNKELSSYKQSLQAGLDCVYKSGNGLEKMLCFWREYC